MYYLHSQLQKWEGNCAFPFCVHVCGTHWLHLLIFYYFEEIHFSPPTILRQGAIQWNWLVRDLPERTEGPSHFFNSSLDFSKGQWRPQALMALEGDWANHGGQVCQGLLVILVSTFKVSKSIWVTDLRISCRGAMVGEYALSPAFVLPRGS